MNSQTTPVQVEFIYLPVINFAMQQNKVSLIRSLTIENTSEEAIFDVKLVLSCEPSFAFPCTQTIESIPAGKKIRIDGLRMQLQTDFFTQLTERLAGNLMIEIFSEGYSLFSQSYAIDVLTYDQWGGVTVLPEMLSAFVTPNHPVVMPVLKRASEILGHWSGYPALDEYQSRKADRVRKQMAAIYAAITELGIAYCSAPASFEEYGQRIRLTDTVVTNKLGNCLDMSLLYASCLEAAGIHPIIVILSGHAFAGGWLIAETFPDSVIDDISLITKRSADGVNEIVLVEATCMNQGQITNFDTAVKAAESKLVDTNRFILALDVKRARCAGIRPLPQRVLNGHLWEIKSDIVQKQDFIAPASVNPYDLTAIGTEIEVTKQLLWERKLLDLSLRNNLLNIRITKNSLQLISADLDRFEDMLTMGDEFRILSKPTDWDNPLYDFGLYGKLETTDPIVELIQSELTQKRLRSYLKELELDKALQHLYRASRLSIEENGANTLYLALGLLKWYETAVSERPRYAPILLLPVEIIRKSAAKGYVIRSREEDTMMNITLLEMLRQTFGIVIQGLEPLPLDEHGVDVRLIYTIIRAGIKNRPRWDVEEQAVLGIFSFNKFVMWNDIHNNADKLKHNKVVASLISGRLEWETDGETTRAEVLENHFSPSDIVLPISADSSQLEAIYEAINDRTYVLHGPPGTGKSQTITNIIANALYRGKRVLFVAEKMAALSVVQNRLRAIGLAPFCLELHSNKVKKSAVLEQLKIATEVVKRASPDNFSAEAARLHSFRKELSDYVEALHKKYHFGFSLYEAISNYLLINEDEPFTVPQSLLDKMTKAVIMECDEAVENMAVVGNACGHPYDSPLTGIDITDYSAEVKEQATESIRQCLTALSAARSSLPTFYALTDNALDFENRQQIGLVTEIIQLLLNIPDLTPSLLRQAKSNETLEDIRFAITHGRLRDGFHKELLKKYSDDITKIDARRLDLLWKQAEQKWFLPKYLSQNKIRKQLLPFVSNGILKTADIPDLLVNIIRYQEEKKITSGYTTELYNLYGKYGKKEEWDTIELITNNFDTLNNRIVTLSGDITITARIKESIALQLSDGIDSFKNIHGNQLSSLFKKLFLLIESEKRLYACLNISETTLYAKRPLDDAVDILNRWLLNMDRLKDWYQWLTVKRRLEVLNLAFVAKAYQTKNIPTDIIRNMFHKSLFHACILYIITREPRLELFKGKLFEDVIRKYKELAVRLQELTKKELYARLAANIPSFTKEAAQSSEVGILQRNIRNNGRGISIRNLFDNIPTLLSRMCPCMLMSPMSVAQFIDPEAEKFDLIVFDEASQMPTYEAVGAIARGKNVVVVGDPKQMPPTNFFTVNTVDEDNIEIEDMESILDDCLALSMPSQYLLWHYRSKHESLIAFSNIEYYDNKLLTFPSPDNIESKVSLVRIEGFYDKGKSRQNIAEARAVVTEIARRLSSDGCLRSIGVVTFSSAQQTLIEDQLTELFVKRPDLEAKALEGEEPLFIKNLENVQGDERDVILFSVGYGPDADGKVSLNFGPLNRTGGERRLNVAVSRARYEMVIYSTLRSDHIDLNRTSAAGVAGLKRFLEYAEKRQNPSTATYTNSTIGSLADIIAQALITRGYQAHVNIGCSGYKIDVGIIDQQRPSNYKLGILCDGENYHRTKTVRDREIVQEGVLKLLGWNICRVWTMDWWENPEEVLVTIEKALVNNPLVLPAETPLPPIPLEEEPALTPTLKNYAQPYKPTILTPVKYSPEEFFAPNRESLILRQLTEVINTEAPISRPLLCKRVLSAWNISRLGQRLDAHFEQLLRRLPHYKTVHEGVAFYWKDQAQADNYALYRTNSGRDATDLPPEEVAIAIRQTLEEQISISTQELARLVAQTLGYARMGANVEAAMHQGLQTALTQGHIKIENARARLL